MDARSDQFSFGVMLYELLTRLRPFEKASKTETLASILRDDPPPPSAINEAIPRDLDRIVSRCLAKNPRAMRDARSRERLSARSAITSRSRRSSGARSRSRCAGRNHRR
jgi:serine/threonine-protein kinase